MTTLGYAAPLLFVLGGCAATYGEPEASSEMPEPIEREGGGTCDASKVQYHVGHDATQAMGEAILKESGAKMLRWGPPNSVWTMDYRPERVSVRYDEDMKITEITCG